MRPRPDAPWVVGVGEGSAGPWLPMLHAPPPSQQQRGATVELHATPH